FLARDPAALDADRIGGQAEPHGGDAGEGGGGPAVGDQAVLGPGQVPEITERPLLEIVDQERDMDGGRCDLRYGDRGGGRPTGDEEQAEREEAPSPGPSPAERERGTPTQDASSGTCFREGGGALSRSAGEG